MEQYVLELLPPPEPTFASFIEGANRSAVRALEAFASGELAAEVLYLWGPPSTGRSHLLAAAVRTARDRGHDAWRLAADAPDPYSPADLCALDDVDRLPAMREQALFDLFVEQRARGGRLLFTADRPPVDSTAREDVRTRLGSGLIFEIAPLTDAEKLAALRARAEAMAIPVDEAVLDYLIAHADRHLGALSAVLASLDRYSIATHRPVTLALARTVLRRVQEQAARP